MEPEKGRYFANVFRTEVLARVDNGCSSVVTTYLDNDDALNVGFVEDVKHRASFLPEGTVINYDEGYQYFERGQFLMMLYHQKNHFISVIEKVEKLKTVYGYGSHSYIDRVNGLSIVHIKGQPMWCEVVHEKNMDNDAYHLRARVVKSDNALKRDFAIDADVKAGAAVYLFGYLPRYVRVFFRRVKYYFFGRHW